MNAPSPSARAVAFFTPAPLPAAMVLSEGEPAPPFEALDQDGETVSSAELAGKRFVLYFYPRDGTTICTREACSFEADRPEFEALDVPVIGVSPNRVSSHKRFAEKHGLGFRLLADPERDIIEKYDAKGLFGRTTRVTYVIGPDMRIEAVHRSEISGSGHVKWAKNTLRLLEKPTEAQ